MALPRHSDGVFAYHSIHRLQMKLKLRDKILASSLSLVLFGMGTLAIVNLNLFSDALTRAVESQSRQQARSGASELQSWLVELRSEVEHWSQDAEFAAALENKGSEAAKQALRDLAEAYPHIKSLSLLDANDRFIADSSSLSGDTLEALSTSKQGSRKFFTTKAARRRSCFCGRLLSRIQVPPVPCWLRFRWSIFFRDSFKTYR